MRQLVQTSAAYILSPVLPSPAQPQAILPTASATARGAACTRMAASTKVRKRALLCPFCLWLVAWAVGHLVAG